MNQNTHKLKSKASNSANYTAALEIILDEAYLGHRILVGMAGRGQENETGGKRCKRGIFAQGSCFIFSISFFSAVVLLNALASCKRPCVELGKLGGKQLQDNAGNCDTKRAPVLVVPVAAIVLISFEYVEGVVRLCLCLCTVPWFSSQSIEKIERKGDT